MKRCIPVGVIAAAVLAAGLVGGCAPDGFDEPVRFSLLAVGDTGARPEDDEDYPRLRRVAEAIAAEDRHRPVQSLLLLGDNFYDRGLRSEELEARVRANLVAPFCHFVALEGTRSHEVADACPEPPARRNPVPIFAVLGNHDHLSPRSPDLQREVVPRFVSNWRMAPGPVERVELADAVSLIAFDSEWLVAGADEAPLRDALHSAPGPWRILIAHRPTFELRPVDGSEDERRERDYIRRVREAVASAGVPVQLFLAGHEHSLQVLSQDAPAPALHVIAGSGSDTKSLKLAHERRLFGLAANGFARVDLVGAGRSSRLVVSLYRIPPPPLDRVPGWRWRVARYAVDLAGNVVRE